MESILEKVINALIMKKFDKLLSFYIEKVELKHSEHFFINFDTSECLDEREMSEIDNEVKNLSKMILIRNENPFISDSYKVKSFFDCGDGQGYIFIMFGQ